MKKTQLFATAAAATLFASASFAQNIVINEIYASHAGTDDQEFLELFGPVGASLDGHVVLIVEGDENSSSLGFVVQAWDLTGATLTDGYYVLGNTAVINNDLDIGSDNIIQNGTDTFYLVETANPAALTALIGTDVDADDDLVTDIVGLGTVVDIVGMIDSGVNDSIFDGAFTIGPDGPFLPAGIFRDGDGGPWCTTAFLDFDDVVNLAEPRTPGTANGSCPGGMTMCGDGVTAGNYCSANPFSTGSTSTISANSLTVSIVANDLVLSADNLPDQPGQFIASSAAVEMPFQNGFLCVTPAGLQRLLPITSPSGGNVSLAVDFVNGAQTLTGSGPVNVIAGTTHYFQRWNRDPGVGTGSNLSDGIAICISN